MRRANPHRASEYSDPQRIYSTTPRQQDNATGNYHKEHTCTTEVDPPRQTSSSHQAENKPSSLQTETPDMTDKPHTLSPEQRYDPSSHTKFASPTNPGHNTANNHYDQGQPKDMPEYTPTTKTMSAEIRQDSALYSIPKSPNSAQPIPRGNTTGTSARPHQTFNRHTTQPVFHSGRASTTSHYALLEAAYHAMMATFQLLAVPNAKHNPSIHNMIIVNHHQILDLVQSSLGMMTL